MLIGSNAVYFKQFKFINITILIYLFLFIVMYFSALNFNYIEGDDASTVLYHLTNRDKSIQLPYASYNSGFDYLIEFTNLKSEEQIRTFSVIISFISSFLVLCLIAVFLNAFLENENFKIKNLFFILIPFIIPDFLFHGLVINSTSLSFTFILLSLIFFLKFTKTNSITFFIGSIVFLGLALPFRWSIITIIPFFMGISIFELSKNKDYSVGLIFKTIIHNILGISLGLFFIKLTGYSLNDIFETIFWGVNLMEEDGRSILGYLASASSFLTIPFIILILFGVINFILNYNINKNSSNTFLLLTLLSISPFFILGIYPSFKFLITLLPLFLIIAYHGFKFIYKYKYLKFTYFLLLFFIWFVGVKLDVVNTFSGPGFEQTIKVNEIKELINEKNADKRIAIKRAYLAFDGGFFLPMPEGPRPLQGYFYVLFGGKWNENINKFKEERSEIYHRILSDQNCIYIQDRKTAFFQCDLYGYGYETNSSFKKTRSGDLLYRDFYKNNDTLKIFVINTNGSKTDFIKDYLKKTNNPIIFRSSYSSMILDLVNNDYNKELELIGPYTIYKKGSKKVKL